MMDLCELQLKLSFSNSVSYYSAGDNGTSNKIIIIHLWLFSAN